MKKGGQYFLSHAFHNSASDRFYSIAHYFINCSIKINKHHCILHTCNIQGSVPQAEDIDKVRSFSNLKIFFLVRETDT